MCWCLKFNLKMKRYSIPKYCHISDFPFNFRGHCISIKTHIHFLILHWKNTYIRYCKINAL